MQTVEDALVVFLDTLTLNLYDGYVAQLVRAQHS